MKITVFAGEQLQHLVHRGHTRRKKSNQLPQMMTCEMNAGGM
jgi:hypothetical protein